MAHSARGGPMGGLELIMWPQGQWEALKKIAPLAQYHKHTDMPTLWLNPPGPTFIHILWIAVSRHLQLKPAMSSHIRFPVISSHTQPFTAMYCHVQSSPVMFTWPHTSPLSFWPRSDRPARRPNHLCQLFRLTLSELSREMWKWLRVVAVTAEALVRCCPSQGQTFLRPHLRPEPDTVFTRVWTVKSTVFLLSRFP